MTSAFCRLFGADHYARAGRTHRRRPGRRRATGSTGGHAAVGALIGGPLCLIARDQLMGQAQRQQELAAESEQNQREIERGRRENERLRHQRMELIAMSGTWENLKPSCLYGINFTPPFVDSVNTI